MARQQQQDHSAHAANVLYRYRYHPPCQTVVMANCSRCLRYVVHARPRTVSVHAPRHLPPLHHPTRHLPSSGRPRTRSPTVTPRKGRVFRHFVSCRYRCWLVGEATALVFGGEFASDDLGTTFEWSAGRCAWRCGRSDIERVYAGHIVHGLYRGKHRGRSPRSKPSRRPFQLRRHCWDFGELREVAEITIDAAFVAAVAVGTAAEVDICDWGREGIQHRWRRASVNVMQGARFESSKR
jgi:hypothetical protein